MELNDEEKEIALSEFNKKQDMLYKRGKIVVLTIAVLSIVSGIAEYIIKPNIIILGIEIALSITLCFGVSWVRYLFAVGLGLQGLSGIYLLCDNMNSVPAYATIFICVYILYCASGCIILLVNKGVSEFLYAQKTDKCSMG